MFKNSKKDEGISSSYNLTDREFAEKIKSIDVTSLELKNIFYIYKDEEIDVVAVNNLSVSFKPGEINVFMGPSGSGKTTLLNIIGGILQPSSGIVMLNNEPIHNLSLNKLRLFRKILVGFIFQSKNLLPYLNVEENIKLGMEFCKFSKAELNTKVDQLIENFNLNMIRSHLPSEISGGQKQKVSFAVAIAKQPKILLADEPTGNLDTKSRDLILQLFVQLKQKDPSPIIIIVSHDPAFLSIADKAYYLKDGTISSSLDPSKRIDMFQSNSFGEFKDFLINIKNESNFKDRNIVVVEKEHFEKLKELIITSEKLIKKVENHNLI